jgi:hypothetical protein
VGSQRAHIVIPKKLVEQIDALVGPRGRSAFIVETAAAEVRKRELLAFLDSKEPVMRDEEHPELAAMGTVAWLKKQREPDEERLLRLHERMRETDDSAA